MALPKSFSRYKTAETVSQNRGIIISIEGPTDSGKTEFCLSCPGPGLVVALDPGLEGCLENPNPPKSRNVDNFAFESIEYKPAGSTNDKGTWENSWSRFKEVLYSGLDNTDARTVIVDGDSDGYELQRLAAFGKLTQVLPHHYTDVNMARKAILMRMHRSGKVIVLTQKLKKEYVADTDENGAPVFDDKGREKRSATGKMISAGFSSNGYLVKIELRSFYRTRKDKVIHGVEILKCKPQMSLIGAELTGKDCNFRGLMELVYEGRDPEEWGELA